MRRPDKTGRYRSLQQIHHRMIARQHQMIAVVDRHADGAVEIGPAAAARIGGGFVHDDGAPCDGANLTAAARPARPAPIM